MSTSRTPGPRCPFCRSSRLFGPAPMRTSAHPNSSVLLVEAPGSRFHDFAVQGMVCLGCGHVGLTLSPTTLAGLREVVDELPAKDPPARKPRRRPPQP